jgi:ABC-type transport system involved in cytochrome bd biosynthesis fused ATPase/permease subunit
MTRNKAFQTAAARRRLDPIVWTIDDQSVRLRATVDLAEIADAIHEVQQPIAEGSNQIKAAADKRNVLVSVIRTFVDGPSLTAFDEIAADLDISTLVEMLNEAIEEYTGAGNPTPEPSSSDGS